LFEREGLIVAVLIFTLPFGILYLFNQFIPLFPGIRKKEGVSLSPDKTRSPRG
jgi:hypothetical protein